VLKPGGRFLCLEFSAVDVAGLDRLYDFFSFNVIPRVGELVVGDGEPYRYLVESIRRFPNQARFAAMIEDAGFARVTVRNLSGGIAAMHSGWKL
jgi:demethylmenaquinone methyltransferase/2-methoxy-6-polyprenyl-1,4-benzoquinol methylase